MTKNVYRVKRYKCKERPHLKAVVNWNDPSGKRCRQYFETLADAEGFAERRSIEVLNQGTEMLEFPTWLRVMAQTCHARLEPIGKTISDATEFYIAHINAEKASAPIERAFAEFSASKEQRGFCHAYLLHVKSRAKRFCKAFPGKLVSAFTQADCEKYLSTLDYSPSGINSAVVFLREFFKWAKKRKYLPGENPTALIEFAKEVETPVGILTPEEVAKLLEAADPEMLAYVAIGAFAGLRSSEIQTLDWSEIDFEDGFIEVTALKAKSAKRRVVKMLPCLRAWLEPVAKKSGRILSTRQANNALQSLRARAGFSQWPKNALRHSYASYWLAAFKNTSELALEMGHAGNGMIFKHYRKVVRESDALRYWNIVPEQPENVLRFAEKNVVPDEHRQGPKAHNPETGGFARTRPLVVCYQKTASEYAAQFKVSKKMANRWMWLGKPLDDAKAMERLARGEYEMTISAHAQAFGVSRHQVKLWRRFQWPLDNVEAVKGYLGAREQTQVGQFSGAANKAVRVIGLSPKDARGAALTVVETLKMA